jgi:hypothetical protein
MVQRGQMSLAPRGPDRLAPFRTATSTYPDRLEDWGIEAAQVIER